jgi:hypothetical protein
MFVSLTSADIGDEPLENAAIVAEEMERWLGELEGYRGFMMLSRPGRALGLVFWETQEVAERYAVSRSQFRERMLSIAGVTIENVEGYEVVYSRLGSSFEDAG